jgi:ribonucleoside-diphosphate reductase alpha chain
MYDLLWEQRSPEGYIKIVSVLQKYIDQGISVNTSYNPTYYEDEKIPMSVMLQHMLMFYKLGGKQLYYFNTFDGQGELDVNKMFEAEEAPKTNGHSAETNGYTHTDDEACESCTI